MGALARNQAWMIASPRMAPAPDDRLVINAIPAQVWRADLDGRIQFVNDVWLDYTGLSVDQTLEWAWTTGDVIHPDDLPGDRKSTRLNSSHEWISYAVFCLKKKRKYYTT